MSKIIGSLTSPSTVIVLLVVIGAVLELRGPSRVGRRLLAAGAGILAAFWILPLGTWLMRPLEDRFPPSALPQHVDGIIVLGGAIDVSVSVSRGAPAFDAIGGGRLTSFVALARRYPQARLVFSGGNGNALGGPPEADIVANLFRGLGLDPRRVLFERGSRNTHENALYSMRLVKPRPAQEWLLVTSAADIPRAVGCFRAVGWNVVAVPVDYHTGRGFELLTGFVSGLKDADWAVHEWLGLLYYRLRGWTPSLYPAPETAEHR
ncbi:MAG: YdcF family protein [Alphaproteobacteria bacterium]|nr:YdcF family protein [Alphaproteobacteria bacterium]